MSFFASAQREREYLFVDGGCLRNVVAAFSEQITGDRNRFEVAPVGLSGGFERIFYYDAISAQERGESVPAYQARVHQEYERFDRIAALDRFHVSLGEIKGREGNRRQKQVDVRIAVDMLTHCFRGNMTKCTLLAGDDDFIPLVQALVREGMPVTVWHPPQATEELLRSADIRRPLKFATEHHLLSRDGHEHVFALLSSGGGSQCPLDDATFEWHAGSALYAGRWYNEELTIARTEDNVSWGYVSLRAKGVDLTTAARAFELIQGWPVHLPAQEER